MPRDAARLPQPFHASRCRATEGAAALTLIPAELRQDRRFVLGLAIRIVAILLLVPQMQPNWAAMPPLRVETAELPALEAWAAHPEPPGEGLAFLYGPVMVLLKAPFAAAGLFVDDMLQSGRAVTHLVTGASLLAVDYALLLALRALYRTDAEERVVGFYWLSPLVLFIAYWHGQADLLPVLLVTCSLLLLRSNRPGLAGVTLGLAIAAKLNALAVLPFLLVFLWSHRRHRDTLPVFLLACLAVAGVLQGAWLLLVPEARDMLGVGGELHRALNLTVHLGEGQRLYLMPIVYLLLLCLIWKVGRMTFDMLGMVLGAAFLLMLLLTPELASWFLWLVPFLVGYQLRAGPHGQALALAFCLAFVLQKLLVTAPPTGPLLGLASALPTSTGLAPTPGQLATVLLSLVMALGGLLAVTMLRRGLGENDFFGRVHSPLTLGLAGDSGTGKNTLALAISGLFAEGAVTRLSGDDYIRFEGRGRRRPAFDPLDPRANDLESFTRDALSLISWRPIVCRNYDPATGLFTPPRQVRASDMVLITGLHVLRAPALRAQLHTAVFLDMDEDLRRFFRIRRDVHERHNDMDTVLAAIQRRRADYQAFIEPQRRYADVVFSLLPADPLMIRDASYQGPVPLKLRVRLRHAIGLDRLTRLLIALCGAQVDMASSLDSTAAEFTVDGTDVQPEDIHLTALQLMPHLEELLARTPAWQMGITGIMQLVVLLQIAELAPGRRHGAQA
jgi:uridine kinase